MEGKPDAVGFFPASFVELMDDGGGAVAASASSSASDPGSPRSTVGGVERATVTFDYEAEDEANNTISMGDVVVVSDKSDADWWEGYVEITVHVRVWPRTAIAIY